MNKDKVNTILEEFCRKYLSPSKDEQDRVSKRFKEIQDILPGNEIFQSGSYGRKTATSPVHDLDVIWVLPESFASGGELLKRFQGKQIIFDTVEEPLESLAVLLEEEYKKRGLKVKVDHSQTHSVNISFPNVEKFSIDIVPAIKSDMKNKYGDDIYLVPEIQKTGKKRRDEAYKSSGGQLKWILSDPKGYLKQSLALNNNPSYRKSVKFIKVWKKSCNATLKSFELKSFHMEMVVAEIFTQNNAINFFDSVSLFFENAPNWLSKPSIPDMADNNIFIDEYLKEDELGTQRDLIEKFAEATLNKFQNMYSKNTNEEIYSLLRESLISTPPWPLSGDVKSITITCQIERKDKVKNSSSWKRIKYNLPKYALDQINGPKPLNSGEYIGKEYFLLFNPQINGLDYDDIKWLVVNTGTPALESARIGGWRGNEFHSCEEGSSFREEHTLYPGMHWIDCFVIKNESIIGSGRFYVGINAD